MIYYIILYKVISHILLYSIIPYEDCHTDVVNHVRFHPADTSKLLSGAEDNLIALRSAGRRGIHYYYHLLFLLLLFYIIIIIIILIDICIIDICIIVDICIIIIIIIIIIIVVIINNRGQPDRAPLSGSEGWRIAGVRGLLRGFSCFRTFGNNFPSFCMIGLFVHLRKIYRTPPHVKTPPSTTLSAERTKTLGQLSNACLGDCMFFLATGILTLSQLQTATH